MSRILIADCGNGPLAELQGDLERRGHRVLMARDAQAALTWLGREPVRLVIVKACRSCPDSLETVQSIRKARPEIPVIFVTARPAPEEVIEALALGAFDCYSIPVDGQDLLRGIEQALGSMESRVPRPALGSTESRMPGSAEVSSFPASPMLVGTSPVMQQVYKTIGRVARTDASVLIFGEPGTGKELVARCIHRHSRRAERPLVTSSLAGATVDQMVCELFGSSRDGGDALHRATGKLAYAHTGTLLIRGVENLTPGMQARLLGVLEHKTLERAGGDEVRVDVRILATTSEDLGELVQRRLFREDLYRRLNIVSLRIPALRDRPDDIPELAQCLLNRFAAQLNVEAGSLSNRAIEALKRHAWPGNVRELEQCIQRVLIRAHGQTIQAEDVDWALEPDRTGNGQFDDQRLLGVLRDYLRPGSRPMACCAFLDKIERMLIVEALGRTHGNRTRAAMLLGLPRPTLHAKIERHGIQAGPMDHPSLSQEMPSLS